MPTMKERFDPAEWRIGTGSHEPRAASWWVPGGTDLNVIAQGSGKTLHLLTPRPSCSRRHPAPHSSHPHPPSQPPDDLLLTYTARPRDGGVRRWC